jgi:NodT family efflux transporter outer membrane factor (OMF) lipoprotein
MCDEGWAREGSWAPGAVSLAALSVVLSGCFGNVEIPEVQEVVETPSAWASAQAEEVSGPPLESWCSDFGDPALDQVVEAAFEDNLNLRSAWARLEQSEAVRRQTNANAFPTVDLTAQGSESQQSLRGTAFGGAGGGNLPSRVNVRQFNASIGAGYELDLWGRLAAQREAAAYNAQAARADVETIALSLTSQVAEAWFNVVAQRQKMALLDEQLDLAERYLELLEMRLSQGTATALDVNQQIQQIEQLKGQRAVFASAERRAMIQLSTLLGRAPAAKDVAKIAGELPEVGPLPDAGVPADLLERRPDLRAAYLRLQAANRNIAVAVRAQLPTVRLSLSTFVQTDVLEDLFDAVLWSLGGNLSQPLIDGGRRGAEVERTEAAQLEAFYSYSNTFVTALGEVESAMVAERYQGDFIGQLELQRDRAQVALELARDRYVNGTGDFLRVLTSLQSLQNIEQTLIDSRRQQLTNRITLCRALGGSWTQELSAPADLKDPTTKKNDDEEAAR